MSSTSRQLKAPQIGKSVWGSGALTVAAHAIRYADWADHLGMWLCELHAAESLWQNTRYLNPEPASSRCTEITAEFFIHPDTLIAARALIRTVNRS